MSGGQPRAYALRMPPTPSCRRQRCREASETTERVEVAGRVVDESAAAWSRSPTRAHLSYHSSKPVLLFQRGGLLLERNSCERRGTARPTRVPGRHGDAGTVRLASSSLHYTTLRSTLISEARHNRRTHVP